MNSTNLSLHAAAEKSLALWHEMVASRDLGRLPSILANEAIFRSPMAYKPYEGALAVHLILSTVAQVFSAFEYHRALATGDGLSVALEFSAAVGNKSLKGVDLIRFDEAGRIVEFEVMIRPLNALAALGAEMGQRLAAFLPPRKAE
jgi:hypothetical protein